MTEDTAILAEMMLQTEVFCAQIEAKAKKTPKTDNRDELQLKISQCLGALLRLQDLYEDEKLTIANPSVSADFRSLVIAFMGRIQGRNAGRFQAVPKAGPD